MDEITENLDVNNNLQKTEENAKTYEKNDTSPKITDEKSEVNYAEIVKEDIRILKEEFGELSGIEDITELEDPLRYAALRDLGLSPAEAYRATSKRRSLFDNRSHLYPTPTVSAHKSGYIPERDMAVARELFSDMSDTDIRRLYKKVTK